MPNITRSALDALSLTNFPNNTSQLISPADLRDWLENGIDSFVTQKDSSRLENVIYENEGSALAASATVNLASATGNFLHITGAATISSFGTCPAGARFVLVFDGICTLTYNATSLIIPGSSNKTTAANDCCMIVSEGSGNWRIVGYFPISGGGGGGGGTVTAVTATAPLASTGGTAPDISIPQANGSTDGYLSSGDWTTFNGKGTGTVTSSGSPVSGDLAKFTSSTDITKATSGTDYLAPPSGTAILKANSGGALANATAGTDYLAPPSGTAIQKANSGGALANATAGTDYVAPGSATGSGLTMASSRLLGRTTVSPNPGAIEEISLTTTGTSGAATLTGGTLNIPQYSGGSGSLTLGSSIVGGASAGRLLLTTTSGANQVLNQDSNLNYDTTNDRLGIGVATPTGTLHLAAGVAANPQVLLVPSAITPTGTTNGSIWCNTVSSNTSLQFYKDSSLTRLITLDRNPDLATSGTALLQADSNGTISKGSELTALGIYTQFAETSTSSTSDATLVGVNIVGSKTLPANFLAQGKAIQIFVSGQYTQSNSSQTGVIKVKIGTSDVATITFAHNGSLTDVYWQASFTIICYATGVTGSVRAQGFGLLNHASPPIFAYNSASSNVTIDTTTTNILDVTGSITSGTIKAQILTANYLN